MSLTLANNKKTFEEEILRAWCLTHAAIPDISPSTPPASPILELPKPHLYPFPREDTVDFEIELETGNGKVFIK